MRYALRVMRPMCLNILLAGLLGALLATLAGCMHHAAHEPVPTSLDLYIFEDHVRTCRERVDAFMSDAPYNARSSAFESCLQRAGYTREQYRHVWY